MSLMTPAQETAFYLAQVGATGVLAGVSEWPVFVGREPVTPINVVTVYDTGGAPNLLANIRLPTVQVRVRASAYLDGWATSNTIYEALVTVVKPRINQGAAIHWVGVSDVAFIGRNEADQYIFTCNYELLRDADS